MHCGVVGKGQVAGRQLQEEGGSREALRALLGDSWGVGLPDWNGEPFKSRWRPGHVIRHMLTVCCQTDTPPLPIARNPFIKKRFNISIL